MHYLRPSYAQYSRLALTGFVLYACGIAERHVDESDPGSGGGSSVAARATGGQGTGGGGHPPVATGGATGPSIGGGAAGNFGTGGLAKGGGPTMFPGGGKAYGGMPPIAADCFDIPSVEPVMCEPSRNAAGEAGAAGFTASDAGASGVLGISAGAGGVAGAAGAASSDWCMPETGVGSDPGAVERLLIDDMEDGDYVTPFFLNGGGAWFAVNDGSGQQFPLPCTLPSPLPVERSGSHFAMHTYGQGFVSAPGGYSLVGITVKSGTGCGQPMNAAAFTGVEFWARGSGVVRFFVGTVETNPVTDFGTCSAGCYDSHGALFPLTDQWQLVRIPFSTLVQEGWGAPAFFDPAHVLTLEWSAKTSLFGGAPASCFDFWIDDVALYR